MNRFVSTIFAAGASTLLMAQPAFSNETTNDQVPLNFQQLATLASTETLENQSNTSAINLQINQHTRANLIPKNITNHELFGVRTVSGTLQNGGWFLIANSPDGTHGAIWGTHQTWEIQGDGTQNPQGHPLVNIKPIQIPDNDCSGAPIPPQFEESSTTHPIEASEITNNSAPQDTDSRVRVLMVYDPASAASVGSVYTYAIALIDSANFAYTNSQANPLQLELAGIVEVDTPPPGTSSGVILRQLTDRYDGVSDIVHDFRDAYDADLVAQLVDLPSFCGRAWLSPNNDLYGFSVSDTDCALGNLTFAHELGHNMGCAHDPDNAGSPYEPYGYGHRWNANQWRSVMAYSPGSRVPHFSNPAVLYDGGATGIENQRDNARLLIETTPIVSNMRTGNGTGPDCNNNGQPDQIDITINPALDIDNDGQPDSCQINTNPALDCNNDGILDTYQTNPAIAIHLGPANSFGSGVPVLMTTPPLATPHSAVTITISATGDLSSTGEYITLNFNNGMYEQTTFVSGTSDCYSPGSQRTFTVSANTFEDIATAGIDLTITSSSTVNPTLCSNPNIQVAINYRTSDTLVDADQNGILDSCQNPCPADMNGDGSIGFPDVSAFIAAFQTGNPSADFNNDGSIGFPDVSAFIAAFQAGCP